MITNKEYLEEFEKQVLIAEPIDLERNLGIYEHSPSRKRIC
ncbi:MAG: hypothetical protein NT166_27880 [Candidatus Aminicenantes bacterium]|nr:hypothetical protein [Candidatus Aminicenantes bacterium]